MTINVVEDPDINAFVIGGNNLFINTGLITFSNNPEAITGVIAHEIAHIKEGHVIRNEAKLKELTSTNALGMVIGLMGVMVGAPQIGLATIAGSQDLSTRQMIGYVKEHEHIADMEASKILRKLNVPSNGLVKLMQYLGHQGRFSGYHTVPKYLRTHPTSQERIDFISRHNTYDSTKHSTLLTKTLRNNFAMASAKVFAFTNSPSKTLSKYQDKTPESLYAKSIAYFKDNKLNKAITLLDDLIKNEIKNPFLYELKGQFYFENSKLSQAIDSYYYAHKLCPHSNIIGLELAIALNNSNLRTDWGKSILLFKEYIPFDPSNAWIWRQIAIAYGKYGDSFSYQVSLAKEADLLGKNKQKNKFLSIAKKHLKKTNDKFMRQVYQDLIEK